MSCPPANVTCGRKHRYSSEFVALNAAAALAWRGLPPMRGYHCPSCDHWHVTHRTGRAPAALAEQKGATVHTHHTADHLDAATDDDPVTVWATAQRSPAGQRKGHYTADSTAHPAKMLPAIAARAIARYTEPDDLVVDPMCGIGTTLVEAVRSGRRAFGVEYEQRWADIARANLDLARADGHTAEASVLRGDARHLAATVLDELVGQAALVVTSPPYGASAHGQIKAIPGGGVHKHDYTYGDTLDRGNLANIGQHRLLSGFTRILAGCARLLRPGGHVVITARPWREHGELVDLPSQIEACGARAGLVPVERCVALLARVADDDLVPRASFFARDNIVKHRAAGLPLHLVVHEDVLVLQLDPSRWSSGSRSPHQPDPRTTRTPAAGGAGATGRDASVTRAASVLPCGSGSGGTGRADTGRGADAPTAGAAAS